VYIVCQLDCLPYDCCFYEQSREYSFNITFYLENGRTVFQKNVNTIYKIINICKDKSRTVNDHSLTFKIGKLKVENTDILTFDLESIVLGYLKKIIVHIKWTLKTPTIVEVRSSGELWWTFVGTFTTRVFIKTSTIIRGVRCSLIYGLFYLFVVRISSRGYLKGAGNNLRRIVNINSWYIEPRSCRPCSKI